MTKKLILIILAIVLIMAPLAARTYTEEEFREVYDALNETNELLKAKQAEVEELYAQIDKLVKNNEIITNELKVTLDMLEETNLTLQEAKKQLTSSNKVIESLRNQKIMLGGLLGINNWKDIKTAPALGVGVTAGYKVWLGYITGNFLYYTDTSYSLSLGYSFVF